ncbi:hypothetical protein vBValMR10Z_41 [Vibrio phage vB_ValM_R10Z]|nr:hypothetical protein vBValMR10Z_41 [Vibrio phage vB_ValM_R10Z]QNJ54967.1 hypothetical protein vBValMR11Z_41 [Vibrio phage vB_ValM_R11Z]URQ03717.1 hypothetical protein PVA23_340 [Vibrio phage PVA23]
MKLRHLRQRLETLAICEFSVVEVRYFEDGRERYITPEFEIEFNPEVTIIMLSDSKGRISYNEIEIEKEIASHEELAHRERFLGI